MGQAISDYFNQGQAHRLVVESELFEEDEIPVPYFFRDFNAMPSLEKKALALCRRKILDVGAGAGAHAVYLQNKGMDVTCIEASETMVNVLMQRNLAAAKVNFFNYGGSTFDTLLFMMNGIGICGTLNQLPSFFGQCKKLLKPGGQVILDSSDIIYLYGDEEQGFELNLNDQYYGEMRYRFAYNTMKGPWFNWLFIGFDLLAAYAEKEGFTCQKIMDGPHYDYLARLTLK